MFLAGCRQMAESSGHWKLASITLEVRHLDPLAVLESIYEPGHYHFYMENPRLEFALAGAEAVVQCVHSGAGRFAAVKEFAWEVQRHTVATGDTDCPFAGPHFFTAFGFADEAGEGPFPAAFSFVPWWQVSRRAGVYSAVANILIEPGCDLEPLVNRVWNAHRKFSSFDYSQAREIEAQREQRLKYTSLNGEDFYEKAVAKGLEGIRAERYKKIVLSRAVDIQASEQLDPLDSLNRLREVYPTCYAFSVSNDSSASFIGATPERLLEIRDGRLGTEAIAGSAPRGATAGEDARFARELLGSDKDLREHQVVIDSIRRRLECVGVEATVSRRPKLLQLSNVQHLHSPVHATVPERRHLLDVLAELHPTPAVGGTPREAAVAGIPEIEGYDRGLYAGALGWFDHRGDGEFVVGIRSALIDGSRARAYAGAGIVEGSDPAKEKAETDMKLRALLENLR